jgi:transcription termination factor NusB
LFGNFNKVKRFLEVYENTSLEEHILLAKPYYPQFLLGVAKKKQGFSKFLSNSLTKQERSRQSNFAKYLR